MTDHTKTIIPIECWEYASPDLSKLGKVVDVGLFSEALLYYDQLMVVVGTETQFASFISWFIERNLLNYLEDLIREDILSFYNFAFYTLPFVHHEGNDLYNILDQSMNEPNSFFKRVLEKEVVINVFPDKQKYESFCRLLEGKVIEGKVDSFEQAINNAKNDYANPIRNSLLLQSLLDELYIVRRLGNPPKIQSSIDYIAGGRALINWNIDLEQVAATLGVKGIDNRASAAQVLASFPLSGAGQANRLILAAMHNDADLYLPRPLSLVVGDKLYEASLEETAKTQIIIDDLQREVDFPDLRLEVNDNNIDFPEVILLRKKAGRFRKWLQQESDHDRDAFVAYHNEVAKEANYTKGLRKALRLFGIFGGGTAGKVLGTLASTDPIISTAIGSVVGGGLTFLADLSSKLGADWKPITFGDRYKSHISKIQQAREYGDQAMNPLGINRTQRRQELRQVRKMQERLNKRKQF